jgi:hypothetical protein
MSPMIWTFLMTDQMPIILKLRVCDSFYHSYIILTKYIDEMRPFDILARRYAAIMSRFLVQTTGTPSYWPDSSFLLTKVGDLTILNKKIVAEILYRCRTARQYTSRDWKKPNEPILHAYGKTGTQGYWAMIVGRKRSA